MRLSEIMSAADLDFWPQVALVMFISVFVGVLIKTFAKSQQKKHEEARFLPLADDEAPPVDDRKVNGHA